MLLVSCTDWGVSIPNESTHRHPLYHSLIKHWADQTRRMMDFLEFGNVWKHTNIFFNKQTFQARILGENSLISDLGFYFLYYFCGTSWYICQKKKNCSGVSFGQCFSIQYSAPCQQEHILALFHSQMHVKISYSMFLMVCNRGMDLNPTIKDIFSCTHQHSKKDQRWAEHWGRTNREILSRNLLWCLKSI